MLKTAEQPAVTYPSPVEQINGELDEARSDLFRATQHLTSDYPTAAEYELAACAVSDAQRRLEYATELLMAAKART